MSTRLFRNANGIVAVERDGVLVYGPNKVYRAVDVAIENRPSEHWVALPDVDWTKSLDTGLLASIGALRLEVVIRGRAAVFAASSVKVEADVRAAINIYVPPKTAIELATERLTAWKAGTIQLRREEVLDILMLLGV